MITKVMSTYWQESLFVNVTDLYEPDDSLQRYFEMCGQVCLEFLFILR